MAQYIKREMPDLHGKGSKQVCYRLKSNGTVTLGDLAQDCARGTTFAEGEVDGSGDGSLIRKQHLGLKIEDESNT